MSLKGTTDMDKITIERELELIDGMIEVQLYHAEQCDGITGAKK